MFRGLIKDSSNGLIIVSLKSFRGFELMSTVIQLHCDTRDNDYLALREFRTMNEIPVIIRENSLAINFVVSRFIFLHLY